MNSQDSNSQLTNYVRFTNEGERIFLGYDLSDEQIEQKLEQIRKTSETKVRRLKYYNYLKSEEWQKLRILVKERGKGICEMCKKANIEATHHLTYKRLGHERLRDLLGVCTKCHNKLHGIKDDFIIPLVFGGT